MSQDSNAWLSERVEKGMFCSKCSKRLEDNWCLCPYCGTEIDKAGGIDEKELNDFIKTRKDTLDVLKEIIYDLEDYGKIQVYSNSLSSGAQIASGILMLAAPTSNISSFVKVTASALNIADSGVTIFTLWKEKGLVERACEILRKDYCISKKIFFLLPRIIIQSIQLYKDSRKAFMRMSKNEKEVLLKEEKEKWFFEREEATATLSVLINLPAFINSCAKLHQGNYSDVADELKHHLKKLQREYDCLKSVSQ